MKQLGIVLIVIGAIWAIVAFNMDTSVETGGERIGSGALSINVPRMRVNNLGLMDQRRNHLMFSGLTVLAGVILFGFGTIAANRREDSQDTRACPYCAETIRAEATICRFCQRELLSQSNKAASAAAVADTELRDNMGPLGICPNCDAEIPMSSLECQNCKAQFGGNAAWKIKPRRAVV